MKIRPLNKRWMTLLGIGLIASMLSCVWFFTPEITTSFAPKPKVLYHAQRALSVSALSEESVWDQNFLQSNPHIQKKVTAFEADQLCVILKTLDTKNKPYTELTRALTQAGFEVKIQPLLLNVSSTETPHFYLKKDGNVTHDLNDPLVVSQEIYTNDEGCVLRIKKDGFPKNVRSEPHSTKAVLINKNREATYENEAFKVTWDGKAVPKGPKAVFGLKLLKNEKLNLKEEEFVDYIMGEAHPALVLSER